jgi:3',5'-cyclic AMP phosphodiesterase CpdA
MTVRKHDANLDGTLNDVIVGHDHAVRRDDEAAPLGLGFPDLAARDAPTFTTRTLTTEGRTEAIVFVAGDRGAASWLCTSDRAVAANASAEFVCERD